MNFHTFSTSLLITLFANAGFAYEVDNFTRRYEKIEPADQIMDKQVNAVFAQVLKRANEDKIGCTKSDPNDKSTMDGHRKFRSYLREAVAPGRVIGVFEESAETSGDWLSTVTDKLTFQSRQKVPRHSTPIDESIYGGTAKNKVVLATAGINSNIKLGGEYIGTDKLGHFFDQGFEYFKRWTLNGSELDALRIGKSSEENYFGKLTTGVKSYADMAANYSGFQFWRKTTEGQDPYFRCSNGTWSQVKDFRWSDFVSAAWDEGINCNDYATKELEKAVQDNIERLENKSSKQGLARNYRCPVDVSSCAQISRLYNAKHFVSPKCRKAFSSVNTGTTNSNTSNSKGGSR